MPHGNRAVTRRLDHIRAVLARLPLWWIVVLAVGLRIAFAAVVPFNQVYDNALYLEFASRLAMGQGLTLDGHPTAFWSAGYPLTLSIVYRVVGESFAAAIVLNIAAAAGMVVLIARIGEHATGNRGVGRCAALITAVLPGLIAASAVTMTEQLYLTAMLAGIWLLVCRRGWSAAAGAGLCFGYATLLRSQSLLLPIAVFAAMLLVHEFRARGWRELGRLAATMALSGVVIMPWVLRNERVMGKATLSTNAGVLMAMGNNPVATGGYMHTSRFAASLGLPDLVTAYDTMHEVEREKVLRSASVRWIKDNPAQALLLWPPKLWITFRSGLGVVNWIRDGIPKDRPTASKAFNGFRYAAQGSYMLLWAAALVALGGSLLAMVRRRTLDLDMQSALLIAGVGYTCVMIVAFIGDARYNVPAYPFLCLSAAAALAVRAERSSFSESPQ